LFAKGEDNHEIAKQKTMSRRGFLKVLAAATGGAATIPLLNACAPTVATPAGESPTATSVPQATNPPEAAPVTLRLWTYDDPGWLKASGDIIKRWSVEHSDVSIMHEHFPGGQLVSVYQTAIAAKNEADIIEMFGSLVYGYAKVKTIAPVPEDVSDDEVS
jgi:ABC-type glycerol-3-phosphate transport system substrate-binding protein